MGRGRWCPRRSAPTVPRSDPAPQPGTMPAPGHPRYSAPDPEAPIRARTALLPLTLVVACARTEAPPDPSPAAPDGPCRGPGCFADRPPPPAGPPLVLFVVLDTVRASSTSLCGAERPTTPFLEELAAAGASTSCEGRTPSSWTVPSHASFFTGKQVHEHGVFRDGESVRPLTADQVTLAERFQQRGYRTVCISANSLVSETVGLTQGCDVVRPGQRNLSGDEVLSFLDAAVTEAGDQPLFVFLNLYQAHDPWQPVPGDVGWVPARDLPDNDFGTRWAYVRGELGAWEARRYLQHTRDLYDYGVFLADRTLGGAFGLLQARGALDRGARLVVTSDHGEFLGEHRLLNHGKTLYEPVTRVPVVSWQWPGSAPALPQAPFSATAVYDLVLDGVLRERPVVAVDMPTPYWGNHSHWTLGAERQLAWWDGAEKVLLTDADAQRYDLSRDPEEAAPSPWTGPLPDALRQVQAGLASQPQDLELDPAAHALLKALGYAD